MGDGDHALVERAVAGDREALATLLERHGPRIARTLRSSIPTRARSVLSIDDVVQDAYTEAFLAIGRFEWRGEAASARFPAPATAAPSIGTVMTDPPIHSRSARPFGFLLTLALAGFPGCDGAPGRSPGGTGGQWLTEITDEAGLTFVHETGATGKLHLPEIMAGGAAPYGNADICSPVGLVRKDVLP